MSRWVAQVAASATCVPTAQEVAGNVALDSSASSGFATPVGSKLPTGATQRLRSSASQLIHKAWDWSLAFVAEYLVQLLICLSHLRMEVHATLLHSL